MKNILYLTKILFLNSMGASSNNKKSKKRFSRIGIISLVVILFGLVFVPMVYLGIEMGKMFAPFGMLDIILKLFLPISSIILIVFSIFSIISTFFLSSDIETLIGLPIKPRDIIIAKFLTSLMTVYLIEFMMFTPIIIGLGIGLEVNVLYYFYTILITIFLPFFPLSILEIVLVSLMRYSAMSKMKDKIQYFIMAFAVIFALGMQVLSEMIPEIMVDNVDAIEAIKLTFSGPANLFSGIMFFTYPASIALSTNNIIISILSMLGFIAISFVGLGIFAYVGEKIYIKGILGKPQIKSKKYKEEKVEIKSEKETSLFKNLVANEWKLMWRSPTFNMNLIASVLVVPIIFAFSFGIGFIRGSDGASFKDIVGAMREMISLDSAFAMCIAIAIFSFFTCFSPISSTAISRDGKHAWCNKVLPINPMTIIYAKMFWGLVLGFIPVVFLGILALVIGVFNIIELIMVLIPIALIVVFTNFIAIMIDLARPKTNWDSEQSAVKQNMNTLFFMLIDWGITALIAIIGVILFDVDLPNYFITIILTLLLGAGCVILNRLLKKKGIEVFKNIG